MRARFIKKCLVFSYVGKSRESPPKEPREELKVPAGTEILVEPHVSLIPGSTLHVWCVTVVSGKTKGWQRICMRNEFVFFSALELLAELA